MYRKSVLEISQYKSGKLTKCHTPLLKTNKQVNKIEVGTDLLKEFPLENFF